MLADFFGRNRNQKDSKCRPLPRLYFSGGYTIHSPFGLMRIPMSKWQERTRFLAFVTVNFTSGIKDLLVVLAKLRTELRSFINFCTIETAQSKNSRDICKCIPGSGIPNPVEFSLASPPHLNSKTCCVSLDMVLTLWPLRWPTFTFSLYYHPWIKHEGQENKGRDHQLKKRLIIKQILLVSTLGNVKRTVWTICILMLGRIGLEHSILMVHLLTQCNSKRRIVDSLYHKTRQPWATSGFMPAQTDLIITSNFFCLLASKPSSLRNCVA